MAHNSSSHPAQKRYPPELRERAVRMVLETMEQTGREVRELRRANQILKAASAFFARELDPRLPK